MAFCKDPLYGSVPISHTLSGSIGQKIRGNITNFTTQEGKLTRLYIVEDRSALGLFNHHHNVLAFEQVSLNENLKFNLFPEIMIVDTVSGTIN